ncbi:hypothetical protein ACLKA7_011262 [Drosophila subpalustris]
MSGVIKSDNANDDGKPGKHSCHCLRRLSRIPLKLLATVLTIYVCILSSERYFMYWVQTTIERTDVHVSEIAFPAITICPTHLVVSNFNGSNRKHIELNNRNRIFNLMADVQWSSWAGGQLTAEDFKDFHNLSVSDIGDSLLPDYKCEDLFLQCMWRRRQVDCCSFFRNFDFGLFCYSFNTMHARNADATWPWSVSDSGFNSGLNVKLNRFVGENRLERVGVIVHEHSQFLGTNVIYSSDDRIVVPLQPIRFTAEAGVKARPVEMRHCYFTDEVMLSGQSRSECIHACHLNYMAKMCKCYFEIPMAVRKRRVQMEDPIRACSVQDLSCFGKHKVSLFSMSNVIEESSDYVFNTTDCKCYPNCNHIEYHASAYTDNFDGMQDVEVDVYFEEETLFSYRSTLYITLLDLMVSYGGIAGLILGTSVIGGITAILDRISCCVQPSSRRD